MMGGDACVAPARLLEIVLDRIIANIETFLLFKNEFSFIFICYTTESGEAVA